MFNIFKKKFKDKSKEQKLREALIDLGDCMSYIDKTIGIPNNMKTENILINRKVFEIGVAYKNLFFAFDTCRNNTFSRDTISIKKIILISTSNQHKLNDWKYVFNKDLLNDDVIDRILSYIKDIKSQLDENTKEEKEKITNMI